MTKEYLAKYRSRTTGLMHIFYKEGFFIYRLLISNGCVVGCPHIVNAVPSRIKGFEEVGLDAD